MSFKINDSCVNCGACVGACPVNAISSGNPTHVINQETCIGCGVCVSECPVEAIIEGE